MSRNSRRVDTYELVRIVAEDLVYLRDLDFSISRRPEVRIASSILRRLLHDGTLISTWRVLGFPDQPIFKAIDLNAVLSDIPRRYVQYAYAGGAKLPKASHTGYVLLSIPKEEHEARGRPEVFARELQEKLVLGATKDFPLDQFCVSPCAISGDSGVSRLQLVRYVANKLGGVHIDAGRAAWSDPLGAQHRFLDENHIRVGRFPAVYYEIMSIAQDVSGSEDIRQLIDTAEREFPEESAPDEILSFREGRGGDYANMTFTPNTSESNLFCW